jgi:hypothetical protein
MMNETRLNDSWNSEFETGSAIRSALSPVTFSNATVDTSRITSCGVTQLLVAPRSLARPKVLVLGNIVWVSYF